VALNNDLSVLRDPISGDPLRVEGETLSADGQRSYPIIKGIPRFVDSENYAADFGKQWLHFRQTQLDSFSGLTLTEDRLRRCFLGDLGQIDGKLLLEAGSGAGRFTEVLLKHGAILHSFDFSTAVEANALNNGASERLTLVQGDIRHIPFERGRYDYVVCLGVLQHTPNPEESIRSLWQMVKPGGRLVIDHYRPTFWLRLPPPLGDAEKVYRWFVLQLPPERRWAAVEKITRFWFPISWRFRNSWLARKILARLAGIHFYYGIIPLKTKEEHYEWALLDTHDGMTDYFKHYRDERQIAATLKALGAEDMHVWVGGNGVEANCRKPAQAA
jgi:SAM-dependent methyltransferase